MTFSLLEEAAVIDGASSLTLLTKIILPLSKSSLAAVGIFNIVYVWNNFWSPLIFLSTRNKKPLPVGLLAFIGKEVKTIHPVFSVNGALSLAILLGARVQGG